MDIGVEFLFSDQTAETLAQSIYKMKSIEDPANRPTLRLGKCMTHVKLDSMLRVLDFSTMKVNMNHDNVPLRDMMMTSPGFLQ